MFASTRVLIIALGLMVITALGCRDVAEPESTESAAFLLGSDASDEHHKRMAERLAAEVLLAFKGEGQSIKKREDTHRMAEANKAFAHFAW